MQRSLLPVLALLAFVTLTPNAHATPLGSAGGLATAAPAGDVERVQWHPRYHRHYGWDRGRHYGWRHRHYWAPRPYWRHRHYWRHHRYY
jgi:hypothetical protein